MELKPEMRSKILTLASYRIPDTSNPSPATKYGRECFVKGAEAFVNYLDIDDTKLNDIVYTRTTREEKKMQILNALILRK